MHQLEYIQLLYAFHFHFLPKNEHETRARFFRVCLCSCDAPKITGCDSTVVQNRLYPVCLFPRADLLASVWTRKLSLVLRHRITGTMPALWLESPLLASMMAVAVTLPELAWNLDFFVRLTTGATSMGLSSYMFDRSIPLFIRAVSLFHVGLPLLLVRMLYRLGCDERAFLAQTLVAAIVLPLSYFFGDPQRNINWVYGFGKRPQTRVPALWFLAFLTLMFPVAIYLPTHLVLDKIFGPASSG